MLADWRLNAGGLRGLCRICGRLRRCRGRGGDRLAVLVHQPHAARIGDRLGIIQAAHRADQAVEGRAQIDIELDRQLGDLPREDVARGLLALRQPAQLDPADQFARQIAAAGIEMEREFRPIPGRKFRLDFAIPSRKLAVECEGRVHRIKERWLADLERRNLLQLDGWIVMYVCREQIFSGEAIGWLKQMMEAK